MPGLGTLPVAIDLHVGDDGLGGTIDVQGNVGLPLSALVLDGTRLRFELQSPLGLIKWDGELRDGVIEGEFAQLDNRGAFTLHRPGAEPDVAAESDPVDGHRSEEVTFANGAFVLAGEVALPDGDGPHPAVVLINGSGDQDRDSTIGQFRLFADLADQLAQAGIASLRWDDRGVGASDGYGPLTTLEDRAGDVEAAVELLRTRPDIDADRIGLIGHSEGGLIAPIVANRTDSVAFVALLASSAVPGDELLRMQLLRILTVAGIPPEEVALQQAQQELILQAILTGEGWAEAELSTRKAVRRELEAMSDEDRQPRRVHRAGPRIRPRVPAAPHRLADRADQPLASRALPVSRDIDKSVPALSRSSRCQASPSIGPGGCIASPSGALSRRGRIIR